MKRKNILRTILIYSGISWGVYGASMNMLAFAKHFYGSSEEKGKFQMEWVWKTSMRNFKKAFKVIKEGTKC